MASTAISPYFGFESLADSIVGEVNRAAERRQRKKDALFESSREWCTQYRCGHTMLCAYAKKALDVILDYALNLILNLLDNLMALVIGAGLMVVRLAEDFALLACYLVMMFVSWEAADRSCCGRNAIIEAIVNLILTLAGPYVYLIKQLINLYYSLLEIYDQLMYKCECERYEEESSELIKTVVNDKKYALGDGYAVCGTVLNPDGISDVDCRYIGAVQLDDKYFADQFDPESKIVKVKVRLNPRDVPKRFKMLVKRAVDMYGKFPLTDEDFCCSIRIASRLLTKAAWYAYVELIRKMYLNATDDFTGPEIDDMKEYCMKRMPYPLYLFTVFKEDDVLRTLFNCDDGFVGVL